MSEREAYVYEDEDGSPLFRVIRKPGKRFTQEHYDGSRWLTGRNGTAPVLYRLPAVRSAIASGETVYVVEGEKDVHAAESAGAVATTNPGGAGKFTADLAEMLRGARVIVVPDKDKPGRAHALDVAAKLDGKAKSVRLKRPREKDLSDHLSAGHTLKELIRWSPKPTATPKPKEGSIPEGGRSKTLASEAGRMRRAGVPERTMAEVLVRLNNDRCEPPLPEREVRAIAASMQRYEAPTNAEREVTVVLASEVPPKKKLFLAEGMIPLGSLTLLAGPGGTAKSQWSMTIGSEGSRGQQNGDLYGEVFTTLFMTFEDDLSATLIPRAVAAGADLDKIGFFARPEPGSEISSTSPRTCRVSSSTRSAWEPGCS